MKTIKTKVSGSSHKIDRTAGLASKMKQDLGRSKGQIENLADDGQITPEEYAQDQIQYTSEDAAHGAVHTTEDAVKKTYDDGKNMARRIKQKRQDSESIKQTPKSTGRQTFKEADKGIKTADRSARKGMRTTEKSSKTAIKTSEATAKTAKKAENAKKKAKASAETAKRSVEAAKKAAEAAKKTAKAVAKTIEKTTQAIAAAIKSLAAVIGTGGAVAVVIILFVIVIALIVGSCFGIFYSLEDDNGSGGMTMQTAISTIDREYHQKINEIRQSETYEVFELRYGDVQWKEVLSVYSAKASVSANDAGNSTMDDKKMQELRNVFWDMHEISKKTEKRTEKSILETAGENGSIVSTESEATHTYLILTVSHKTPDEMASKYGFNKNQKAQLSELLDENKSAQWTHLLYSYPPGNEKLAVIAKSQIGKKDGQLYWGWCGFAQEVKWDGCFVCWCAGECGYIDSGVIPKRADCQNMLNWFKNHGQWKEKDYVPQAGDIVFFDRASNGMDGTADQVGIVEKVQSNSVFVIIGDYEGECVEKIYNLNHSELLGYGVLGL